MKMFPAAVVVEQPIAPIEAFEADHTLIFDTVDTYLGSIVFFISFFIDYFSCVFLPRYLVKIESIKDDRNLSEENTRMENRRLVDNTYRITSPDALYEYHFQRIFEAESHKKHLKDLEAEYITVKEFEDSDLFFFDEDSYIEHKKEIDEYRYGMYMEMRDDILKDFHAYKTHMHFREGDIRLLLDEREKKYKNAVFPEEEKYKCCIFL